MDDHDLGSLPILPSVILILPIFVLTGLLCWATVQNRRRFTTVRQMDVANQPSEEDEPELYEIWVENNLKVANEHLVGRDRPMYINDKHGDHGDRSLHMLIQLPVALGPASSDVLSSDNGAAEHGTVVTLIRMPQKGKTNYSAAEVLIGISPVRIMDTRDSSEPKT